MLFQACLTVRPHLRIKSGSCAARQFQAKSEEIDVTSPHMWIPVTPVLGSQKSERGYPSTPCWASNDQSERHINSTCVRQSANCARFQCLFLLWNHHALRLERQLNLAHLHLESKGILRLLSNWGSEVVFTKMPCYFLPPLSRWKGRARQPIPKIHQNKIRTKRLNLQ